MSLLASRFGSANSIRRERPLTIEELFRTVPSVFSEEKHDSCSERYTYIPTITLLDSLQERRLLSVFCLPDSCTGYQSSRAYKAHVTTSAT